jgi:hypothetical protein
MRFLLLLLCLAVAACGVDSASRLQELPASRRQLWEELAPLCGGYPSKQHCDDGDMALFGGLLCAAGDARGCRLVRDAQGSDGRWWRSPRRNPGNLGERKSFSRDQSNGVLLYLTASRDRDAAARWLAWIESSRPCLVEKPGGGCLVRGPHRFCTDEEGQMCTVNPATWAVLARVWEHLDLPWNDEMRRHEGFDSEILVAEAEHAPLGYETHLPGVEVLLKQLLNVTRTYRERAARILSERQPANPFFAYLHEGPSPELEARLLELCPQESWGRDFERRQWAWERDTASEAWRHSMGWDCLFLANLLDPKWSP